MLRIATLLALAASISGCQLGAAKQMGNGYVLSEGDFGKNLASAERGDGKACYTLSLHFGLGLGQENESLQWLWRSAEYGYPTGMWAYGISQWNVARVSINNREKKKEACRWIRRAAAAGDKMAIDFIKTHKWQDGIAVEELK